VIEDVVAVTPAEGIVGLAVKVLVQHLSEFETDLIPRVVADIAQLVPELTPAFARRRSPRRKSHEHLNRGTNDPTTRWRFKGGNACVPRPAAAGLFVR